MEKNIKGFMQALNRCKLLRNNINDLGENLDRMRKKQMRKKQMSKIQKMFIN